MQNIDLDQARRRAKELLQAAKAGDPDALARLPRRRDPIVLADAHLAIARELGFPSWPKLVASVGWSRARYDDVDWTRVRRVTIVPFISFTDDVVIPEDGLPSDELLDGEDAFLDAVLRIPLEQCGFRRQGTHVFAIGEDGTHVAMWVSGDRYDGDRPHRADSVWWTGPAADVDDPLVQLADEARRSLTHEEDQADARRYLDPSYLNADTPQGGSGFSGTLEEWRDRRQLIVDAIDADGTFLDVGCANGFLMECVVEWCAEKGITIEPYGFDASSALVRRAQERLPQWADRIWVGDALYADPPRTFDVVHSLLDFVRPAQHRDLIENVLRFVRPGGRLVISQYGRTSARELVEPLGYEIAGETRASITRGLASIWLRKPE